MRSIPFVAIGLAAMEIIERWELSIGTLCWGLIYHLASI